MAVAFKPGSEVVRGDLDIFLTNAAGNPVNAASIVYSVFFMDPGPPESEVPIATAQNLAPVNPAVGEYYASFVIPAVADVGTYRVRWTFRELANSPQTQVVQEFAVVVSSTVIVSPYSVAEREMIEGLRVMLRDNCVGAEETVELDVNGELVVVRMDDLWRILGHLSKDPKRANDIRDP